MGRVTVVDDIGQIHVTWENGSSLALVVSEDSFQVLEKPPVQRDELCR